MYKAVIFDLDGTLLDTLQDLKNSINEALKNKGYEVSYSYDETKWLIGSGIKKLCERAISKYNPSNEEVEELFKEFTKIYKKKQLEETHPFIHVNKSLFSIKQMGCKVCVLSNKAEENVKDILHHYFPNFEFDHIVGQRKNVPVKPDPTSLLDLINVLDLSKKEVLYVGDSDVDMLVADKCGIDKCAVTYGYRPIEMLVQYNPNYIVSDFREILEILKNK